MISSSGLECGPVTIYFRAGSEHAGHKTVPPPPTLISLVTANLLSASVLGGISPFNRPTNFESFFSMVHKFPIAALAYSPMQGS